MKDLKILKPVKFSHWSLEQLQLVRQCIDRGMTSTEMEGYVGRSNDSINSMVGKYGGRSKFDPQIAYQTNCKIMTKKNSKSYRDNKELSKDDIESIKKLYLQGVSNRFMSTSLLICQKKISKCRLSNQSKWDEEMGIYNLSRIEKIEKELESLKLTIKPLTENKK